MSIDGSSVESSFNTRKNSESDFLKGVEPASVAHNRHSSLPDLSAQGASEWKVADRRGSFRQVCMSPEEAQRMMEDEINKLKRVRDGEVPAPVKMRGKSSSDVPPSLAEEAEEEHHVSESGSVESEVANALENIGTSEMSAFHRTSISSAQATDSLVPASKHKKTSSGMFMKTIPLTKKKYSGLSSSNLVRDDSNEGHDIEQHRVCPTPEMVEELGRIKVNLDKSEDMYTKKQLLAGVGCGICLALNVACCLMAFLVILVGLVYKITEPDLVTWGLAMVACCVFWAVLLICSGVSLRMSRLKRAVSKVWKKLSRRESLG